MRIKKWFAAWLLAALFPLGIQAQSYDRLWKQLEQAEQKSLPKTVGQIAAQICGKARSESDPGQFFKAYMILRHSVERLTPDSVYTSVREIEQLANQASDLTDAAIWHYLAAEQYADLYRKTPYRPQLSETYITGEAYPADIRTWSRNQLLSKIIWHIDCSLSAPDQLSRVESGRYLPFVEPGEQSAWFDHSMLVLLGRRSVSLLSDLPGCYRDSLCMDKVRGIYHTMMAATEQLKQTDGSLLLQFEYLQWRKDREPDFSPSSAVKSGSSPYQAELDRLLQQYAESPLCAELWLEKARLAVLTDSVGLALRYCDTALDRYPSYVRIHAVQSYKENLLLPELTAHVDGQIYPGAPVRLRVYYKNLSEFTLRLSAGGKKVASYPFVLTGSEDHLSHDTLLVFPAPQPGAYALTLHTDSKQQKSQKADSLIVSRLKVLTYSLQDGQVLVKVLDSDSGHPLSGVRLVLYTYGEEYVADYQTDADGTVLLKNAPSQFYLQASLGEDKALPRQYFYNRSGWNSSGNSRESQLLLLTDRSIYRPGQVVYVKGVSFDRRKEFASVSAGKSILLRLLDTGGREIASRQLTTNEFGSFSTEFTLPEACLNGNFQLLAGRSSTTIRVESYKRPTFEVGVTVPDVSYQSGDTVAVRIDARSFSGVPLAGSKLTYTVKRTAFGWWRGMLGSSDLLLSGEGELNTSGEYLLPVPLLPLANPTDTYMFYEYQIEASVQSLAGETQSTVGRISVGKNPVWLTSGLEVNICKDNSLSMCVQASNNNGNRLSLSGVYELYLNPDNDRQKARATQPLLCGEFHSSEQVDCSRWRELPSGRYLLVLRTESQGLPVEQEEEHVLFSLSDTRPPVETPLWFYAENTSFDAAHPAVFYLGTSCRDVYAMIHVQGAGHVFDRHTVTALSDSIWRIEIPYQAQYGDGVTYNFCFVKGGEVYQKDVWLTRRIPEHQLQLKWKVFRDKLRPGQSEEWTLAVTDSQGHPVDAEILATLYDASLDRLWKHEQPFAWQYHPRTIYTSWFAPTVGGYFDALFSPRTWKQQAWNFDRFVLPAPPVVEMMLGSENALMKRKLAYSRQNSAPAAAGVTELQMEDRSALEESVVTAVPDAPEQSADLRTDLQETAFFYPTLRTDSAGLVTVSFTLPQSLTTWRFRGYAHTKDMHTGILEGMCTASKDFMLTPNIPRFVRVGDRVSVSATLANLTGKELAGNATLTLFDPLTEQVKCKRVQPFTIAAGQTSSVCFSFEVDNTCDLLACRVEADGGSFSDGEQHYLPVLSNRIQLVETVALPVRGKQSHTLRIDTLFNGQSRTADHRRLTVEFTGNPSWYAVQALPALAEPQNRDALSWAAATYASGLAAYVANSTPAIRQVFNRWKQNREETLQSSLARNPELKTILLEQTPWLLESVAESEQMARIALLFDQNQLQNRRLTAVTRLHELQQADGSWAWYPGMKGNRDVTLYIMTLQARLARLTGEPLQGEMLEMQRAGWRYLNRQLLEVYRQMLELEKKGAQPSLPAFASSYLYLTAISGEVLPVEVLPAVDYFRSKTGSLLQNGSMADKARAAIVLDAAGEHTQAAEMMASLREHLVKTEERGMYFAFQETPYAWAERQLPAHVQVMEAFNSVARDAEVVEEMKIWLLKQKQVSSWNSPVATADAVYALLMTGNRLTSHSGDWSVTVGKEKVDSGDSDIAGLGYVQKTFTSGKVLEARKATIEKRDEGIAWGALYAQFTEDLSAVGSHASGIRIQKDLFTECLVNGRRELTRLDDGRHLKVGDKVVVRLTLYVDRAMEFVTLTDMHAACLESVSIGSGAVWQNGLSFYKDQKDASACYFFDQLPKGVYVIEETYRTDRTGSYECGLATLQSAYAPEFSAHSASVRIQVD